jgi:hypothetical protein
MYASYMQCEYKYDMETLFSRILMLKSYTLRKLRIMEAIPTLRHVEATPPVPASPAF